MVQLSSQQYHILLSQPFHCGCHSRSKPIVTTVPKLRYNCDNCVGTSVTTPIVTLVPKTIINPPNNLFEHETQQNNISQNRQATSKEDFNHHCIQTYG